MHKFLKPFHYYYGVPVLLFGVVVLLLGSAHANLLGIHFNGMFNIKFLGVKQNFLLATVEQIIDIFIPAIVLFSVGFYLNSKPRFIDVLAALAVIRLPLIVLVILQWSLGMDEAFFTETLKSADLKGQYGLDVGYQLILFSLISLLFLGTYVYYLVHTVATFTNSTGWKTAGFVFLTIVTSEVTLFFTFKLLLS